GIQLLAATFAVVGFLRVPEATVWAEHIFLPRCLEYFPASTLRAGSEFARLLLHRALSRWFNLPRAFFDEDDLARSHVVQRINHAARPSHFNRLRFRRLAESEMGAQVVLGIVAAAAANLINLCPAVSDTLDPRAGRRSIRFHPDQLDRYPVVIRRRIRPQQNRKIVDWIDHHVKVAVIVEIAERAAATGCRLHERPADL